MTETPKDEAEAGPSETEDTAPAPDALPATEEAPLVTEEERLAPGIERLGKPTGSSKEIPETILGPRPSPIFLAVVSITSLVADVASKLWAESRLDDYKTVTVMENHLTFLLAKNKGGAWGLLQGQSENVRRPFFLLVSVAAIAFIVTLYRRLQPKQHALKWGLPLVLGGALGNVFDRIRYGYVIDFIDYRADWIKSMNTMIQKRYPAHLVTDHWPTFNVADIAICVGVALMAVDMMTSKRGAPEKREADVVIEPDPPADGGDAGAAPQAGAGDTPAETTESSTTA